ncbi:94_t:CDS:2 [Entrophospora sp. SA101]|nr:94_t:CDS:2 [Entrophospora sp. SA101]
MILDEKLFIVKEFDSFVIPDSGIDFKQMINVVISIKKFKSVKVPSRFDEVHNAEGHKNN